MLINIKQSEIDMVMIMNEIIWLETKHFYHL